jgi:hypothetical protein
VEEARPALGSGADRTGQGELEPAPACRAPSTRPGVPSSLPSQVSPGYGCGPRGSAAKADQQCTVGRARPRQVGPREEGGPGNDSNIPPQSRTPALGELKQRRRAEGRPKLQVEEVLETAPAWCALVLLQLDIPQLGHVFEVVGGHPNLLLRHGALLMEIGLTTVDEDERIRLAIETWKVHLLEPGRPIVVVLAGWVAVACRRRWIGGQRVDCLGVGLGGGLEELDGPGELLHGGLEVILHGRRSAEGGGAW